MIERTHPTLSVGAQCRLLSISRSSFYYTPQGETAMNLDLMLLIDKQFLDTPFYGCFVIRVVPGNPIAMMLPPGATEADIARLSELYGFDKPLVTQFGIWVAGVLQGDFRTSITTRLPVRVLVLGRLPATLELSVMALVMAMLLGGAAALTGTRFRGGRTEGVIDVANGMALSVPDFLWGLVLVLGFGVLVPVFHISGRATPSLDLPFTTNFYLFESVIRLRFDLWADIVAHMFMPALALAIPLAAIIGQLLKQNLKETMNLDYVTLARTMGYDETRVILREALRNAALPTLTLLAVQFTFLIGGTVIIERLFSYEGLGNMAIDAVINRDLPLIQGIVLLFAAIFTAVNLIVDMLYAVLNPRLRHAGRPLPSAPRGGSAPLAFGRLAFAALPCRALRALDRAEGPAGSGPLSRPAAALLDGGVRAGLSAWHRLARPGCAFAHRPRRARGADGGPRRGHDDLPCRRDAGPSGRVPARLAGHGDLAPDRHLDGLSAGPLLYPADRRPWPGPLVDHHRHRRHRLDPFRPCRPAEAMVQGAMDYVASARVAGRGQPGIMVREILPNVLPAILVLLTLEMGIAVIIEAILPFVNLSISTDDPTWGGMISEGRLSIHRAWWVLVFPLVALFLTVLAFSQLGEGLKDRFDPVLR